MIKVKVNNEYKDVVKIFCGGTLQKEIIKVWSREAQEYVYESFVEYTGSLPITINANGDALLDYRIYGDDGGGGVATENLFDKNSALLNSTINSITGRVDSSSIGRFVSDYIKVNKDDNFTIVNGNNNDYFWLYDINKKYTTIYYNDHTFIADQDGYIRISNNADIDKVMLIKGSTAPTNYIPYGYKLPMTVYKQEFKVTSDMLDQSNWILSPPYGGFNVSYFIYFDISDFISKVECDAKIYKNFTEGYVPRLLVVALTDDIYPTVDTTYRILNNNGTILNKRFDFSSWNKVYLCIGYGDGFGSNNTKQSKIDELFGNWKILIAPTLQTQEAPIYIGENQLDAIGEYRDYVDFGIQKIARKIREYTFTGNETFNLFAQNAYGTCWVNLRLYTTVAYCPIHQTTLRSSHFTAINNSDANFWYEYPQLDDACNFEVEDGYDTVKIFFRSTANFSTAEECKAYFKEQYDNGTPVKIWFVMKYTVGQYESTDNGKEDPPVPLPEIPSIKGEAVIDYDGDPKPSQMYIKYRR